MNRNLNRRIHPIAEADGLSPKKNLVNYFCMAMSRTTKVQKKSVFPNTDLL